MNVKWLLEPTVFQHDAEPLVAALARRGIEHKICEFGKEYGDCVNAFDEKDCVIFYGSLQCAQTLRRFAKWVPGIFCTLPKYECLYYYPRFGSHLLNSQYTMLPFGELARFKDKLFLDFGLDDCVFVRPSSGYKTFTGRPFEKVEWEREIKQLAFRMDPEALILVSTPRIITREWRLVVSDHVIAASQYKEGTGLIRLTGSDIVKSEGAPPEVLEYGQTILNMVKYRPDPIWTLDICESGGELKVLEVGSFSCAGLYACDPDKVIDAVNAAAWKEWEEVQ